MTVILTRDRERHASIMAELKATEKERKSLGIATKPALVLVQAEILQIVGKRIDTRDVSRPKSFWGAMSGHGSSVAARSRRKKARTGLDDSETTVPEVSDEEAEKEELQLASQVQQLTKAVIKLKTLQKQQEASLREIEVIRSLYFTDVFRRFEKIPEADARSNEWAFNPLKTTFSSWLESQDGGDGLYYIHGKVRYLLQKLVLKQANVTCRLAAVSRH